MVKLSKLEKIERFISCPLENCEAGDGSSTLFKCIILGIYIYS